MQKTNYYVKGQRYIIPTSDWGFKKLFATEENKGLLIGLLNRIIDGPPIDDLEYLDREVLIPTGTVRFDVYCKCSDGSRIIVEMQKYARANFIDRAIVYTAASILDGFKIEAQHQYRINRTYLIAIIGENIFPYTSHAPVRLALCDIDDPGRPVLNDKVLQIFIELPKFAEKVETLSPDADFLSKFAVALKTMNMSPDRPDIMDDDMLIELYKAADLHRLPESEKKDYEKGIMNNLEYEITLWEYKTEGRAEGKAEGRAEGRAEGIAETAAKMKAHGIPPEVIAECTGLDLNAIAEL